MFWKQLLELPRQLDELPVEQVCDDGVEEEEADEGCNTIHDPEAFQILRDRLWKDQILSQDPCSSKFRVLLSGLQDRGFQLNFT